MFTKMRINQPVITSNLSSGVSLNTSIVKLSEEESFELTLLMSLLTTSSVRHKRTKIVKEIEWCFLKINSLYVFKICIFGF